MSVRRKQNHKRTPSEHSLMCSQESTASFLNYCSENQPSALQTLQCLKKSDENSDFNLIVESIDRCTVGQDRQFPCLLNINMNKNKNCQEFNLVSSISEPAQIQRLLRVKRQFGTINKAEVQNIGAQSQNRSHMKLMRRTMNIVTCTQIREIQKFDSAFDSLSKAGFEQVK